MTGNSWRELNIFGCVTGGRGSAISTRTGPYAAMPKERSLRVDAHVSPPIVTPPK